MDIQGGPYIHGQKGTHVFMNHPSFKVHLL
jgi:hypothetical protein